MTVFVLWRIVKDLGEDATRELAGIYLTKDEAERAGMFFWHHTQEVEVGKYLT